jgi:hypothetical protein
MEPRPVVSPSRWDAIEYVAAPAGEFVAPEAHWPAFARAALSRAQRIRLNRLALQFSCEMVAHFERYVVEFLQQHPERLGVALSPRAVAQFAADEDRHIQGFLRLLAVLEPRDYPEPRLRFLRWDRWDRLVVRWSPAVSFFVATDLLEEMFLHLHHVMEEHPEQTLPVARQVMALHAREEHSHLAMDAQVIVKRQEILPGWKYALQAAASLVILAIVDAKSSRAWRLAVRACAPELRLSSAQLRVLERRRLSLSDQRGLRAFIARWRTRPFPGSRLVCWLLGRQLDE